MFLVSVCACSGNFFKSKIAKKTNEKTDIASYSSKHTEFVIHTIAICKICRMELLVLLHLLFEVHCKPEYKLPAYILKYMEA